MESNTESPLFTSIDAAKNPHFRGDIEAIPPIKGANDFFVQFGVESKKLWYLADPAIFTTVCQYSLGGITQTFAGHAGTLDLAAVSVENSVIAGFSFGVMVGMGSALETLCGQAFGAGQVDMLGVYMQRSWVILLVTALLLLPTSSQLLTPFDRTNGRYISRSREDGDMDDSAAIKKNGLL